MNCSSAKMQIVLATLALCAYSCFGTDEQTEQSVEGIVKDINAILPAGDAVYELKLFRKRLRNKLYNWNFEAIGKGGILRRFKAGKINPRKKKIKTKAYHWAMSPIATKVTVEKTMKVTSDSTTFTFGKVTIANLLHNTGIFGANKVYTTLVLLQDLPNKEAIKSFDEFTEKLLAYERKVDEVTTQRAKDAKQEIERRAREAEQEAIKVENTAKFEDNIRRLNMEKPEKRSDGNNPRPRSQSTPQEPSALAQTSALRSMAIDLKNTRTDTNSQTVAETGGAGINIVD